MLHFSSGVVTRLVQSYLLPFHKRCLSFVLVCSIWSLLLSMETMQTEMLKHTIVLLPSGRSCVSTRCHRLANSKRFDIITISQLCAIPACVMRVCPPILTQSSNRPPILSSLPMSQYNILSDGELPGSLSGSPTKCPTGGLATASHLEWSRGLKGSERTKPQLLCAGSCFVNFAEVPLLLGGTKTVHTVILDF